MSVKDITASIERLKKEYTHPQDRELLSEWENRLSKAVRRNQYLELDQTREIVSYLTKRYKDIRIMLSSDDDMDQVDISAWHKVAKEIKGLLGIFVSDAHELGNIENQIREEVGNL